MVPAVTMRAFAEEFSTGSYEVLATLPVTHLDVLIGKFTGAVGFVVLVLAPTVLYPVVISRLGDLDWGPVVAGLHRRRAAHRALLLGGHPRLRPHPQPDRRVRDRPGDLGEAWR